MSKEDADSTVLITCTAEVLDDDTLKTLLVSAQPVILEICVKNAVKRKVACNYMVFCNADEYYFRTLKKMLKNSNIHNDLQQDNGWRFLVELAEWFPHISVGVNKTGSVTDVYNENFFFR